MKARRRWAPRLGGGPAYLSEAQVVCPAKIRRGGLTILPARMHEVHTFKCVGVPFTRARTRWMFGSQRRFVRRWEWDTFIPKFGCFPQISHTAATLTRSSRESSYKWTRCDVSIHWNGTVRI